VKLCFIGSGMEQATERLAGIEVASVARVMRAHFDTLVFGGSSEGLMESFARAFAAEGGNLVPVVPRWLHRLDQAYRGVDPVLVEDLAERKGMMFDAIDGLLVYPGGIGTWDELFDLVARRAIDSEVDAQPPCPPIYVYNWEKYYAPLLLQIEVAAELGLIHPRNVEMIRPFESADALAAMLR